MRTSPRQRSTLTSRDPASGGFTTGHILVRERTPSPAASRARLLPRAFGAAMGILLCLPAGRAAAALVLFEDGRHLHVKDFQVVDDDVTLRFEEGGSMTI